MRHFMFYPHGGPFPGTCLMCRGNKDLYDTGSELLSGGNALICTTCIEELATFTGYTLKEPLDARIAELEDTLVSRETSLKAIPDLTEGLIDGIRSSLADFVFAVSSSGDVRSSEPVQKPKPSSKRPSETVETAE